MESMYELHDICLILQDNIFVTGEFDRIIDSIFYLQYLLHYLTDNHLSLSYVLDYTDWITRHRSLLSISI